MSSRGKRASATSRVRDRNRASGLQRTGDGAASLEATLPAFQELWEPIFDTIPDLMLVLDREHRIVKANRAMAERLGVSPSSLVGSLCCQVVHGTPAPVPFCPHAQMLVDGREHVADIRLERLGGLFEVVVSPLRNRGGDLVGAVHLAHDVTEREAAAEALQQQRRQLQILMDKLCRIEDEERRRIADALHDGVGQNLVFAKLKLSLLRKRVSGEELRGDIDEVLGLVDETIRYTRSLTSDLSPPLLYELSFMAAAKALAERIEVQHGVPVVFCAPGSLPEMSRKTRALLYKSLRELLVNVVKHAVARRITVLLEADGGELCIAVEDDGIGFVASREQREPSAGEGFGILSVRERLRVCGGTLEIVPGAVRGASVRMRIPFAGLGAQDQA